MARRATGPHADAPRAGGPEGSGRRGEDEEVGLCTACRHGRVQRSGRGSAFWRCARAEQDPRFQRYPRLPVHVCAGFQAEADGC